MEVGTGMSYLIWQVLSSLEKSDSVVTSHMRDNIPVPTSTSTSYLSFVGLMNILVGS